MVHPRQWGRINVDRVHTLHVDRIGPLIAQALHGIVNRTLVCESRDYRVFGSRTVGIREEFIEGSFDQHQVARGWTGRRETDAFPEASNRCA